ncbi:MAG: ATP-binding protein [Victivallales bacterium]|nr:ATP-binding protein [Victivallales bacterium]
MKPWRQIAKPHRDVLEGTLKQAEFAADLRNVLAGNAAPEYLDAKKFFARTYITEGMRLLLISVAQRLAGKGGDPVIQLQTNFGGGKTHTLLAVYHLVTRKVPTEKLAGIPALLDEAGITELPQANLAVIDGNDLSPNQPVKRGALTIRTIWGLLAYQLLGAEGYEMVAPSDSAGTAPGKEIMIEVLRKAAPCVLLCDELVAFFRQLDNSKELTAGSFESNISFMQILMESVKAVPNAILLASLPESDTEATGTFGRVALNTLEKYFARLENVWKPVGSDEAFEIVRRRLFEDLGDATEMETVCQEYANFYRKHKDRFPPEVQESRYLERMKKSYPIHPEFFDRLYEDWSTLDSFQRTRGVLQYMAIIIHRLWNANDQDPMIMPGSIPLSDVNVRNKSTGYLPQGWDPIIEKEIDGPDSEPTAIDGADTRSGSIFAATRASRTIFLGSAPSSSKQGVRGVTMERILLGCAIPGQTLGIYEDVLKRLRDRLHYLFADVDRFWFDTRPNLRREMESRKLKVETSVLNKTVKELMGQLCGRGQFFSGVHVFTPHEDIPDDIGSGPRLVVLPLDQLTAYAKANPKLAFDAARKILEQRGEQPRIHRNRLLFLVPDLNVVSRVVDQARTYLAWGEIVTDIDEGRIDLGTFQAKQTRKEKDLAYQILKQELLECYRFVLEPTQSGQRDTTFEVRKIGTGSGGSIASTVEKMLCEEQVIVLNWSPVHLKNLLQKTYFTNGQTEIPLQKVWQDCCNYFQMPRLLNEEVFTRTVCDGVSKGDFFGYAMGKEGDKYLGFEYASPMFSLGVDQNALLIAKETAEEYKAAHAQQPAASQAGGTHETPSPAGTGKGNDGLSGPVTRPGVIPHRHYFGTIELDPISGGLKFQDIMSEVIQHFASRTEVKVTLKLDIDAESSSPFDTSLERIVKENGSTLGIKGEFSES